MFFGGRSLLLGRNRGDRRMGFGREGGARVDDTPMLRRRGGSMSELMDGIGGLYLGGGGRSSLGSRGSSLFGGRLPMDDDLIGGLGGRREGLSGRGIGMGGLGSRDSLLNGRAGQLGGSGRLGGSSQGSTIAGTVFDLQALDRSRMPCGPLGPRLSNYRSPYIEDYFSEIDPDELLLREEMERMGYGGFWLDNPYEGLLW
jgi:hypothetical protein